MARTPRIYFPHLSAANTGRRLTLEDNPAHYVAHVLRLSAGHEILLFSALMGEWLAEIVDVSKKSVEVKLLKQTRAMETGPDIWLLFAPVKNEKIDFLARRATELGVSAIQPIRTKHTIVSRVNEERLVANMIEAAEQCGRLDIPELKAFVTLDKALSNWEENRILLFADESGEAGPVHEVMQTLPRGTKAAVIIGPEGGFSADERGFLRKLPYIKAVTLGPRILRAETAALTALAHAQAWLGDGDKRPHFETLFS